MEYMIRFRKYETDPKIRFIKFHVFFWNGFWDPFHTFLKRITYSVSEKKLKIAIFDGNSIIDHVFRFIFFKYCA